MTNAQKFISIILNEDVWKDSIRNALYKANEFQAPGLSNDELEQIFNDTINLGMSYKEFANFSAELYEKYFSDSELEELLLFNQTPLGVKMLATMPLLQVEVLNKSEEIFIRLYTSLLDRELNKQSNKLEKQVTDLKDTVSDIVMNKALL